MVKLDKKLLYNNKYIRTTHKHKPTQGGETARKNTIISTESKGTMVIFFLSSFLVLSKFSLRQIYNH